MAKKKKTCLTKHAKLRFSQRTSFALEEYQALSRQALEKGYDFSRFEGSFKNYLKSHTSYGNVYTAKVYQNLVFIFRNSENHPLITVYEVPKCFLPIDKFLITADNTKRWITMIKKDDSSIWYWSTLAEPTQDIDSIMEFKNTITATNYLNNDARLLEYAQDYEISIF